MKTFATVLLLGLLLPLSYSQQSNLYQCIPYIDAKDSELGIEETGSGLLAGHERHRIYLVTAYHVVAGMDRINVRFRKDPTSYPATLAKHDRELDLAVLFISATLDTSALERINIKMEEDFTKGEPVFSIGHPFGEAWQLNDRNILLEPRDNLNPNLATITPEAIVPGCSGGPVFDLNEELIGLVLRENEIDAPCARAYTIKQKLQDWGLPSNLILTNEEWWNGLSSSWRYWFSSMVNSRKQIKAANRNIPSSIFFQELFAAGKFECNNCGLTDLAPLKRFTNMQQIVARGNKIREIAPLAKMRRLRFLDLRNNDVQSLEPLAELYEMEEIDLKNNRPLSSLAPLRNLNNLRKVNFTRTGIRSIEPLFSLSNLKTVKIFLTDVPYSEIRFVKNQLSKVRVRFRPKREGLSHLLHLILNPAREEEGVVEEAGMRENRLGKPLVTPVYTPAKRPYRSTQPTHQSQQEKPATNEPVSDPVTMKEAAPPAVAPEPNTSLIIIEEASPAPPQITNASPTDIQSADAYAASPNTNNKADTEPAPSTEGVTEKPKPKPPIEAAVPPKVPRPQQTASPNGQAKPKTRQSAQPPQARSAQKPQPTTKPGPQPQQEDNTKPVTTKPPAPSTTQTHEAKLRQLLLDRKPAETESQAFVWLGEHPNNNLYRVYVVLGRVYQGKYDKAKELWFFFKNKKLNDGLSFTDKVVAEIDRLEKLGATNGRIKKFRNQIAAEN